MKTNRKITYYDDAQKKVKVDFNYRLETFSRGYTIKVQHGLYCRYLPDGRLHYCSTKYYDNYHGYFYYSYESNTQPVIEFHTI